jgi:hypothetical protein
MKWRYTSLMAVGLALLWAVPALPQPFNVRAGIAGGLARLLESEKIQKELGLTPDQVAKGKELNQHFRERLKQEKKKVQDLKQEDRAEAYQAALKKLAEETNKAVAEILKPAQLKRLKEIELQVRGSLAFNDPEIEKKLQLTDDQKDQIRTILKDARKDFQDLIKNPGPKIDEAVKKATVLNNETLQRIRGLLTAEQRKTWADLTGKRFELDLIEKISLLQGAG